MVFFTDDNERRLKAHGSEGVLIGNGLTSNGLIGGVNAPVVSEGTAGIALRVATGVATDPINAAGFPNTPPTLPIEGRSSDTKGDECLLVEAATVGALIAPALEAETSNGRDAAVVSREAIVDALNF